MVTSLSCDCPSRQYYSILRVILILLRNLGPNRNSNTNSNVQPSGGQRQQSNERGGAAEETAMTATATAAETGMVPCYGGGGGDVGGGGGPWCGEFFKVECLAIFVR
jgi:hypothetical protein